MKKYIVLFILLLASNGWCQKGVTISGASFSGAGASAATCPTGAYMTAWNGDYPSHTTYACLASGASTLDAFEQSGGTVSSDYGETGVGFGTTANDQRTGWTVTSANLINGNLGTMWISVKFTNNGENGSFWEYYSDANNNISCIIGTSALTAVCYHKGNGETADSVTSDAAITVGEWFRVGYTWDRANNTHCVRVYKIGVGSKDWVGTDCDADTMAASFAEGATNKMFIGERYTGVPTDDAFSIDNLYIMSTYQAADPL